MSSSTAKGLFVCVVLASPLGTGAIWAKGEGGATYVVLKVTGIDGKVFHKPLPDKEQAMFKKNLEAEYQKARKTYQEEKKTFESEHRGQKFEKPLPHKPAIVVVRRDLKTLPDAKKAALDLDRELESKSKNGKNGKSKDPSREAGEKKDEKKE